MTVKNFIDLIKDYPDYKIRDCYGRMIVGVSTDVLSKDICTVSKKVYKDMPLQESIQANSKFDIGDIVYVLYENGVVEGKVIQINVFLKESHVLLKHYMVTWWDGPSKKVVSFEENMVFKSFEDLIDNLKNNIQK